MLVSAVCPTFNEERYIEQLLRFFVAAKPDDKELIIVDGESQDRTRDIVRTWQQVHSGIRLVANPQRYVPYALNAAIPLCDGTYIVRLDAHTEYAEDYFEQIVATFERTGADIVGGPTRTRAQGPVQAAIAHAICTRFGIGNSRVHQEDFEGYTDSVTFGAWRRDVFAKIGLFDTQLVRNQDDEFHYRAKSLGLSIFQSPHIKLYYHPRGDLRSLAKQYYQYGFYKPLVLSKVPSEWKWRHLIPSLFVVYLLILPILLMASRYFLLPLVGYLVVAGCASCASRLPWRSRVLSVIVYPTIHLSYGAGFLSGSVWAAVRSVWRDGRT